MQESPKNVPDSSGVYFFKKGKSILYIGKATSLRSRVRSYFSDDIILMRGAAIRKMVAESTSIRFETTESVIEALILEALYIKKYQPKYNVREKDDKSFNYVVITREKFPRVLVVRGKDLGAWKENSIDSFGPFPHGAELKEALRIIRRIFPFKDTTSLGGISSRLMRQLSLDPGDVPIKEYARTIAHIRLFFSGKKSLLLRQLAGEMHQAASQRNFERAVIIRNRIFALKHINDIALLKRKKERALAGISKQFRIEAYDIAHISGTSTVGSMAVLVDGESMKSAYRRFKMRGARSRVSDDIANLEELLRRRLAHPEWEMPDLVVIDGGIAQKNRAERIFNAHKLLITIVSVVKDEHHRPKKILGPSHVIRDYRHEIVLANSEAHRFALSYHRKLRSGVLK